jgi:hypothetical protein
VPCPVSSNQNKGERMRRVRSYSNMSSPCFTFFAWNLCVKCHKEFRREAGWSFRKFGGNLTKHLCSVCAPTGYDADRIFLRKEYVDPYLNKGERQCNQANHQQT